MRIGIDGRFIDDYYPGIGRYTFALVQALGALPGDDEYFVYLATAQDNSRYPLESLAGPTVHLRRVTTPGRSPREHFAWRRWAAADRLDAVHFPYYFMSYLLRVPTVVTLFDVIGLMDRSYIPSTKARVALYGLTKLTVERATKLITSSEASRLEIVQRFPKAAGKLDVVPIAAEPLAPGFRSDSSRPPTPDSRLPTPFFLYVGTNKPHKNLARLIRGYARSGVNAGLVLAGRHDARFPEVQDAIRETGAGDRIVVTGEVDEATLDELYRGAIATVTPSLAEGFGLPALEAMIRGCPLVSSNQSSLPEVAGDAALYFDPRDEESIAGALRRIAFDPALRERLAQAGLERARSEFSWESTARQTRAVYRAAIEER